VLGEQLELCTINGQPAVDIVYVEPAYRRSTSAQALNQFDTFLSRRRRSAAQPAVAEVKAINPAAHGVRYQLAQQSRRRELFMSTTLDTRVRSAFATDLATADKREGGRIIGLF
jgi:hypothetical protein